MSLGFGLKFGVSGGSGIMSPPAIANQTVSAGRLSLINGDFLSATNGAIINTGGPVTSYVIDSQSVGLDHWEANTDGIRNKAVPSSTQYVYLITPSGPGGPGPQFQLTINTEADEYAAHDRTALEAVIALGAITLSGKTIKLRNGSFVGAGTRISITSLAPAAEVIIVPYGYVTNSDPSLSTRPATLPGIDFSSSDNFTIRGVGMHRDWEVADATLGRVVDVSTTDGITVDDCEISSNNLSTVTMESNPEVLTGIGRGSNSADNLTATNNYIHDVRLPIQVTGTGVDFSDNQMKDCTQSFGEFNDCPSLTYKDNRGKGIWANGTDPGNPHSSLLGFSATSAMAGIDVIGNWLTVGRNRIDALGGKQGIASGPKLNDTTADAVLYDNVEIAHNAFLCTDGIGLEVALCTNTDVHHNLIAVDEGNNDGGNTPAINYHDIGTGCKIWSNATAGIAEGTDRGNGIDAGFLIASFDNVNVKSTGMANVSSGDILSYAEQFDGTSFNDIALDDIETVFTPTTGKRLLIGSINIGPFGTGYYNHSTGVATNPTLTKPITTTATGVDLDQVLFDGTNDVSIVTDATDPLLGMTDADELTMMFALSLDASDDASDVYVWESAGASLSVRKLTTGKLRWKLEDAAGATILEANSSLTMTSADGLTVWAFSAKLSTYQVHIMKGTNIDPLVNITQCSGDVHDVNRNSLAFMGQTSGGRMNAIATFGYITDEFIDLHTVANLDAIVALDGKPDDYGAAGASVTGTQPRGYLTGDAAAWNAGGGLNLGSDANKFIMTGAVEDVSTINDVRAISTTWIESISVAAQPTLTIAMKIRMVTLAANSYWMATGLDTYLRSNTNNTVRWRGEYSDGSQAFLIDGSTVFSSATDELSIVASCNATRAEIVVNGTLEGSADFSDASLNYKIPAFINAVNGSGGLASSFDIIGPVWMANEYLDASDNYSNFFDGSDDPIFGTTVNSVTADLFLDGDAAFWNALSGGSAGATKDGAGSFADN